MKLYKIITKYFKKPVLSKVYNWSFYEGAAKCWTWKKMLKKHTARNCITWHIPSFSTLTSNLHALPTDKNCLLVTFTLLDFEHALPSVDNWYAHCCSCIVVKSTLTLVRTANQTNHRWVFLQQLLIPHKFLLSWAGLAVCRHSCFVPSFLQDKIKLQHAMVMLKAYS